MGWVLCEASLQAHRFKLKAVEAERMREIERRRQEEEEREKREREERDKERQKDKNISGEEAWRRRAALSGGGVPRSPSPPSSVDGFMIGKSETVGLGVGAGGQMTAAQRMMAKMGWKQGQGLGKQEQGITTPLMAKKTDSRAGVIVNASETKPEKKVKSVNLNGPTRVLMLRNMAYPRDWWESLEWSSHPNAINTLLRFCVFRNLYQSGVPKRKKAGKSINSLAYAHAS